MVRTIHPRVRIGPCYRKNHQGFLLVKMVLEKPRKWKDELEGVLLPVEIVFIEGVEILYVKMVEKFNQWQ